MKTKCKACKGTGWDNRSACMNCNGSGLKIKKEIPDSTSQLKADKEELIENHFKLFRRLNSLVNRYKLGGFEDLLEKSREINRKHSEGGFNIVQSNP